MEKVAHRSASVGPVLEEHLAGWMAHRFYDDVTVERRMFRDEWEAEEWAAEWVDGEGLDDK
jgi:hypothetical protein